LAIEQALDTKGALARPDGTRQWRLKAGELEIARLLEAGTPVALELKIPLSEKTELVAESLKAAVELAETCAVRVVDPQLGRAVSEKDEGAVTDQFLRTARYAGEMMGVPEAVAASFGDPDRGVGPGLKVVIGLGGVLVLLYFLVNALGRML
jgi:hypothetical protein